MAWTVPRTWVASETVTAALMNTHVRDNLKAIGDAWTGTYTLAWTSAGAAPTVGNASRSTAYMQAGKLVWGRASITLGSTSAAGTGAYRWALPVAAANATTDVIGSGIYDDTSTQQHPLVLKLVTATTFLAVAETGVVTAASPTAPVNGDTYTFFFMYEAA